MMNPIRDTVRYYLQTAFHQGKSIALDPSSARQRQRWVSDAIPKMTEEINSLCAEVTLADILSKISDEAVESAARMMYNQRPRKSDPVHWETDWEDVDEKWKDGQRRAVKQVLAVAVAVTKKRQTEALSDTARQK